MIIGQESTYLLLARHDLPEEVDVGGVKLGQEGFPILYEEGVELFLAPALLLELHNIYFLKMWLVGVHGLK